MSENEHGWYLDPSGRHRLRYWNGTQWTDQVNDGNVNFADPIEQELALVPPAPGTKPVSAVQQQPAQQPSNISVQTNEPRTGIVGILIGALVIVVLVIGLLIVLDNNDDSNDSGDTTPTSQVSPTTAAPTSEAPTTAPPSTEAGS